MTALKSKVHNRGVPPDAFLSKLIAWGRTAPGEIFAPNPRNDIYTAIKPELGPWQSPLHRRAAMLEVMRVLAGFESSWDWNCGIDTTRVARDTPENSEAGAWQVSYDSRHFGEDLRRMLKSFGCDDGIEFQIVSKAHHDFAMEYVARLMRWTTRHNGPLYRNRGVFPKSLQHGRGGVHGGVEVKKLPDSELNQHICEWLGLTGFFVLMKRGLYYRKDAAGYTSNISEAWRVTEAVANQYVYPYDEPVTKHPAPLPSHILGLEALGNMHEAEKRLETEEQIEAYLEALTDECGGDTPKGKASFTACFATARQRATALLLVVKPEVFEG